MQNMYCGFLGEGRRCALPSWYTWIAHDTSCEMQSGTSEGNFTLVKCFVMCVENIFVSAAEDGSGRHRRLKVEAGHEDRKQVHATTASRKLITRQSFKVS